MERYSVSELLVDLAGCRARRVLLFVEQSYSTTLAKRLRGSLKHLNVALLGSAYRTQTASFWGSLHPSHCLIEHLDQVRPLGAFKAGKGGGLAEHCVC